MKSLLILLLLLPITTFSQIRDLVDGYDLYTYSLWISGEFTSTLQSTEDEYFDNVFIKTVKFRSDEYGDWFYTTQGEIVNGIPYRERIYLLNWLNDTTLINRVYKVKTDIDLDTVSYKDLEELCGCHTYIYKSYTDGDWYYYGETNGNDCKGSFRGATYTTSQFRVYEDKIISWERGWSDVGKQVWGSTKGAYQYLKIK